MKLSGQVLLLLMATAGLSCFFSSLFIYHTIIRNTNRLVEKFKDVSSLGSRMNNRKYDDKTGEQSLLRTLLNDSWDDGYIPLPIAGGCPYSSIRHVLYNANKREQAINPHCKIQVPSLSECEEASQSYPLHQAPPPCKDNKELVCTSLESARETAHHLVKVSCNISACGENPVYVASLDRALGKIESIEKWKMFTSKQQLEDGLPSIVVKNALNGFGYCFLKCTSGDGNSRQINTIFLFPPLTGSRITASHRKLPNINIVGLDSISRVHFYRALPKTVQALRKVVYNTTLASTVLDYQFLQAFAPYTFTNFKALFTGSPYYHTKLNTSEASTQDYDLEMLYGRLKAKGYKTLLLEDLCWFAPWGLILTNNLASEVPSTPEEFSERWRDLTRHAKEHGIDDIGPTHASCVVFKELNNTTQQFSKMESVCYGGKPFISYFLEHVENTLRVSSSPVFSFTLLNVGHETTGLRIQQADERLAEHVSTMAGREDTITVLLSDHGPKASSYSGATRAGKYELYSPLMFILLPERAAKTLGKRRVEALIANQNKLVTLADVNAGVMSYLFPDYKHPYIADVDTQGIFGAIARNRSCAELSIQTQALCVCAGNEEWYPDNHPEFLWVGEYAVGELNNRIQQAYNRSGSIGGYGRCQRLVGISFAQVYQKTDDKNTMVAMSITVQPLKQVFEVVVKYPKGVFELQLGYKRKQRLAKLLSFRRISTFNLFLSCKDESVPIMICICRLPHLRKTRNWQPLDSPKRAREVIHSASSFKAKPHLLYVDGECLVLSTRTHRQGITLVYELANVCRDRVFSVRIEGRSVSKVRTSRTLPMHLQVSPLTVHFAFTAHHYRKPHDFVPIVSFNYTVSRKTQRKGRGVL